MRSWLAKKIVSRLMARLRDGDYGPTLRMDADDVRFRFPGRSSWGGEYRGKRELEGWYRRFVEAGLQIFPDQVVATGLPWNMTLCVRGHIYLRTADGEAVYENRFVIWGTMAWGKLRDYEVYEDTEQTAELERYLATSEKSPSLT
jgi:ketosteroid isomerase-like protein